MDRTDLLLRMEDYARRNNLVILERLGSGMHGTVSAAKNQINGERCALKAHERDKEYRRERDVYLRLEEHGVTIIRSCHVPQMTSFDDQLWVIEMTLVKRPFVLDFAGAYLDQAPDFSEEVLADWRAEKQEQFGPRWPDVQAILGILEGYGVFMLDVNPGNVSFGD